VPVLLLLLPAELSMFNDMRWRTGVVLTGVA
jgi:hypothetical protein